MANVGDVSMPEIDSRMVHVHANAETKKHRYPACRIYSAEHARAFVESDPAASRLAIDVEYSLRIS